MVGFDSAPTLGERFRRHFGDRTHLYAYATRGMADDWEAGGPVREVCLGYEDAPAGSAIQLRLLAGLFRLVLTGRADELRPYYPCLGGHADPAGSWPVMRSVIAAHVAELHEALRIAPQTNEVGRSAALLAGLFDVVGRTDIQQIRLLELGASAGLNLLVDHFRILAADRSWAYGPVDSPLQLTDAVEGSAQAPDFAIIDRRGCDLHPIDPATAEGRLLLTSFVWPFDLHRHERLRAAFAIVDQHGSTPVDAAPAGEWLRLRLEQEPADDVLTVVWRSITQQYWPAEESAAVESALIDYGSRRPLAAISLEFARTAAPTDKPELRTATWAGDSAPAVERLVGTAHDHGIPVRIRSTT